MGNARAWLFISLWMGRLGENDDLLKIYTMIGHQDSYNCSSKGRTRIILMIVFNARDSPTKCPAPHACILSVLSGLLLTSSLCLLAYFHSDSLHFLFAFTGMVGMMGAAALTKKRGGYTNTKMHGIMAWVGMMMAGGGLYVIYQNKESMGKNHFTTLHSWGKKFTIPVTLFCAYRQVP